MCFALFMVHIVRGRIQVANVVVFNSNSRDFKKKLPNFFLLVNSSAFLNENLFNLFFKFYKNFYKNLIVKKKVNDRIINTEFSIINKNNLYDYSLVDNKKYFKNNYFLI